MFFGWNSFLLVPFRRNPMERERDRIHRSLTLFSVNHHPVSRPKQRTSLSIQTKTDGWVPSFMIPNSPFRTTSFKKFTCSSECTHGGVRFGVTFLHFVWNWNGFLESCIFTYFSLFSLTGIRFWGEGSSAPNTPHSYLYLQSPSFPVLHFTLNSKRPKE